MFCLPLVWIVGVFVSLSTNLSKFWNWFESLRQVITSYHTCSSKSSSKFTQIVINLKRWADILILIWWKHVIDKKKNGSDLGYSTSQIIKHDKLQYLNNSN